MFIGREYELSELSKLYQKDSFQLAIFYGRRRIGKTRLIQEFVKDKKVIYFTAIESTAKNNLQLLSKAIFNVVMPDFGVMPEFSTYDTTFKYI